MLPLGSVFCDVCELAASARKRHRVCSTPGLQGKPGQRRKLLVFEYLLPERRAKILAKKRINVTEREEREREREEQKGRESGLLIFLSDNCRGDN